MPEQTCPKCGAELHNTHKECGRIKELWRCWSFRYDGGVFVQTDQCRIRELTAEVDTLQSAIRSHRDQRGDDRCWMDDEALYKVLPEGYEPPARDTAVELANCQKFIESRRCPATEYVSPQRHIAELTAEAGRLREENERLREELVYLREQDEKERQAIAERAPSHEDLMAAYAPASCDQCKQTIYRCQCERWDHD